MAPPAPALCQGTYPRFSLTPLCRCILLLFPCAEPIAWKCPSEAFVSPLLFVSNSAACFSPLSAVLIRSSIVGIDQFPVYDWNRSCFSAADFSLCIPRKSVSDFDTYLAFLSRRQVRLAAIIGIMITSVIVLYLHETMLKQQRLTEQLKHKNEIDFTKYNMLKDKYADLRVMAHDFNKYCKSIEGMLGENSGAALEMIRSLEGKNRSLLLVEYTDNDALNVLLTQKSEECLQKDIDFQVYIQDVSLSFINEADTVAIFANLMDNAIEASGKSAVKKIFLSIYEMNNAFTVIRLDNSADSEPVTEGGALMTSKSDKDLHGIGTVSIKQALRKYGGDMEWSYDRDEKKFNTTILINHIDFSRKN